MIAISYRREDSMPVAGRLHDRLQAEFGRGNVFMDFDSIPYGVDFREQITETLERARIVIAVIGPDWLGPRPDSGRRIDDPADFVRLEIGHALRRGIPIVPVLVNKTAMPKAEELPADIEGLAFRNALVLDTGIDFHHHTDRLIAGIHKIVDEPAASLKAVQGQQIEPNRSKPGKKFLFMIPLLAVLFAAVWFFGFHRPRQIRQDQTPLRIAPARSSPAPNTTATAAAETRPQPKPATAGVAVPSTPAPKLASVYRGTIHPNDVSLAIEFGPDRKSGRMTQTSKRGDTVVKFTGFGDGTTLHAVTDELISKPERIRWDPESFTLRFFSGGSGATYECKAGGITYFADLEAQ